MWMMGYNDGGDFDSIQDPFTGGRKLRPLMPRPSVVAPAANPPCFSRINGTDLLALNHHLAAMAEQNKRELTTQQVVVSTRWNPTPEQLQTLEEMYRRGTRTPSADQIQQITAQLRRYGKIEGKNVFYWFQNHKARERQKRRRQLESLSDEQPHHNINHQTENIERRQEPPGANRRAIDVEQTNNWASLTNLSTTTTPEKTAQRAAECKKGAADGWLQLDDIDDDEADISQERRNATWQMKHLSCSSSSSPTINSAAPSVNTCSATITVPSQEMQQHQDSINIFLEPYYNPHHQNLDVVETQTLQLFPLHSGGRQEEEESGAAVNSVAPYQYFEFLPLKN